MSPVSETDAIYSISVKWQ